MTNTTTYDVKGMTCDHCVRAVTEEIGAVDGVTDVDVSLEPGVAVVTGDADPEAVTAAVAEAGFEVTGVRS
ncbi:MAG TPA: heavy-metal-associated domain-containing protein [Acidimicrobiales bacterium]|nr:heavy-metal-associated domain-containing protein [Acidimicrobiales bacterium]